MRITFVLPTTGCYPIGGVRVVYEYANRLKAKGHEVNVVYPLFPPRTTPGFSLRNLRKQVAGGWHSLKRGKKIGWFNLEASLFRILTISPKFAKLSQWLIPDADFVVATAWDTAYFVASLSDEKGCKLYFVQHYEIWDMWDDEKSWEKAGQIEKDPNKLCLAMHDVIPENSESRKLKVKVDGSYKLPLQKITISSWLKQLLEEKFHENVLGVIINGVNFGTFHREDTKKTGKSVLMPYRPIRWKGTEDGLKAFLITRKKHPEAEFAVYGVEQAHVSAWVKNYGEVSDEQLRSLYNHSDIFVLPSWVEGSQLPPMEAMACGCAVVATQVGGVPDYTLPGETCLVSPPRNPEALAQNIIRLLGAPEECQKLSEAGHDFIKQFTWDRATNQMEKMLMNLLNNDAKKN